MSDSLFPAFVPADPAAPSRAPAEDPATKSAGNKRPRLTAADLLKGLNDAQREAVSHEGGPVLVVAGAGSGKTRVLTRRIAWLVAERNVHPGSILAITFTNKAAAEMRSRVAELIGNRAKLMWVSTFHSACVRILRAEIGAFGMKRGFSIYDDADSKRLMQLVIKDLGLDSKRYPVRTVMNWVSSLKNELVDPESASTHVRSPFDEPMVEAYREYQRRLRQAEALDFDDLISTTVHLLRAFPAVREQYRRRCRHVLVDEYQDTNHAQYALVRELCGEVDAGPDEPVVEPADLMVVGDSDQSIYAFRGATIRNIIDFERDFPGASTVTLDQNYRSTQNILTAANQVIVKNPERRDKKLWSAAGDGEQIVGYVADTEHEEAQFIASEIDRLHDQGTGYNEVAVFYRTNAQSRAFEDVFIRTGLPYKVVGGVRFYERKEIRDAIAYLRAIANPSDDVSVRRILNVPRRGIGAKAEEALERWAAQHRVSFADALPHAGELGLASRSVRQIQGFVELMDQHREMVAAGEPADAVLSSILRASGYVAELEQSTDPQDETRLENLVELVSVAQEFVAAATTTDLTEADLEEDAEEALEQGPPDGDAGAELAQNGLNVAGAPEPDDSLPAFLERVALVADADQIPDADNQMVTLMTLHTAKGLEFDTVFLTGFEDGMFPHQRTLADPAEIAEERRLAYVGLTRARRRLYLTRSQVRSMFGSPQHNPASRFWSDIPEHLMDWRRVGTVGGWRSSVGPRQREAETSVRSIGSGIPSASTRNELQVATGDRVLHSTFGMGTVVATHGAGRNLKADVDFGSAGLKRLLVQRAPLEKL
ncbi:UvrD-helicase domain-containing protein [Parenemella sanctibonifatiensis]|uniref:DNA 3'-5' helicase n=1 Tax=Parenemella sanctibonifatiensis TaxID=2016505 RepID=A0A255ERZ4_9ACTN|nr:UvrD-helicase domain-containing protein [Parenemella sanctibonifatiensis]OYN92232.1 ATP-dependent DNA helicase PcrA [Parenemella sanctibonifatiensis]